MHEACEEQSCFKYHVEGLCVCADAAKLLASFCSSCLPYSRQPPPCFIILWFTLYHVYACSWVFLKLLSLVLPGSCSLSAYWAIWQLVTAFYCLCCLSTYCIWLEILVLIKHLLISAFLETAAAFRIQQLRKSLFLVLFGHPPLDVCKTHVVSFMVVLVKTVLWAHRIVDSPLQPQCKPVFKLLPVPDLTAVNEQRNSENQHIKYELCTSDALGLKKSINYRSVWWVRSCRSA